MSGLPSLSKSPTATERGRPGRRCRGKRGAVPALVRSHRRAAAHQGAWDLLPSVVPRRQPRLSARPAAHARVCARHLCALRRAHRASLFPRAARRGAAVARQRAGRSRPRARGGRARMKAMLLAAGRGERLRPITDSTPKPLVRVGGRPLIAWHLAALARAGIREVVINLSWLGAQVRATLGDGRDYGVLIIYSDEGPVPLETGGGIFRAVPLLGPGPFLVVNADIWTDIDFAALTLEEGAHARLLLIPNPPHHPRGDFGLEGDLVGTRDTDRYTYSGVGVYRPEFFGGCIPGSFPLLPLLNRAIAAAAVRGQVHRGEWCDVGTVERLASLDARLRALQ